MATINARKVKIIGDQLYISTLFRTYLVGRDDIVRFRIARIPSLFDEIGLELQSIKCFFVTERVKGFLDLAEYLRVKEIFGPLWYRDVESGRKLEYSRST